MFRIQVRTHRARVRTPPPAPPSCAVVHSPQSYFRVVHRFPEVDHSCVDRLANLRRIGIDEISYKKNHQYVTIVVDHDTTRLVGAAHGHDQATLSAFSTCWSAPAARGSPPSRRTRPAGSARTVARYCLRAIRCADP